MRISFRALTILAAGALVVALNVRTMAQQPPAQGQQASTPTGPLAPRST